MKIKLLSLLLTLLLLTGLSPALPEEIVFEDGLLGVKFSFTPPEGWEFQGWGSKGTIGTTLLLYDRDWRHDDTWYEVSFDIAEGTVHPADWHERGSYLFDWSFNMRARALWQQPDEPSEVFVTSNGLTVVTYVHTNARWGGDYTTALFIFRPDGRDYREIEGAQIFYTAMLDAPLSVFEENYEKARSIVNSLKFHETAEISLNPSEEARNIGITSSNYPRIDGATSTVPLAQQLFTAMFEPSDPAPYQYEWERRDRYSPYMPNLHSRTVPSYELLIGNYVDMLLVPDPSDHVLALAENAGVELEFIPIGVEALVFITHADNPVRDITKEQIIEIYSEMSITNWAELGGLDGPIIPWNRNWHSGSQTLMNSLILRDDEIHPELEAFRQDGMGYMLDAVLNTSEQLRWMFQDRPIQDRPVLPLPNTFGLGYTVYFYLREAQERFEVYEGLAILAVDGVFPSHETMLSGEYPLAANYFAVIRADSPPDFPARLLANWLTAPAGQEAVEMAGIGTLSPLSPSP